MSEHELRINLIFLMGYAMPKFTLLGGGAKYIIYDFIEILWCFVF